MLDIEVYSPGTNLVLKRDPMVTGFVDGILIDHSNVEYRFARFVDGQKQSQWLHESELLSEEDARKMRIQGK